MRRRVPFWPSMACYLRGFSSIVRTSGPAVPHGGLFFILEPGMCQRADFHPFAPDQRAGVEKSIRARAWAAATSRPHRTFMAISIANNSLPSSSSLAMVARSRLA